MVGEAGTIRNANQGQDIQLYLCRIGSRPPSWEPAERLLIDMLKLPQVRQNPSLLARVSDLLSRTVKARKDTEARRQDLFEDDDILAQCPALGQHYDAHELAEYNRRVRKKASVLSVGR